MMQFRTHVTMQDVQCIRQMVMDAGVFSTEEINVAEELADDAAQQGEASHYRYIIADDCGKNMGYTCYGRIPLTDERYDLYWIVTDAQTLRKGVATALMRQTEQAIAILGGKMIYAETSSRALYAPAQRFYLKQGFSLAATVKDFYRKDDDKLLYGKTL